MILGGGPGPRLKPQAFGELIQVGRDFQATAVALYEQTLGRIAQFPESDMPEGARGMFVALARTMLLGEEFKAPGVGDDLRSSV